MPSSIIRKSGWVATVVASAFALFLSTASYADAATTDLLSKKQVKELVASANSPEDHLRLSRYYTVEADRLDAEAKKHEALAAEYRTNMSSQAAAMKNPMAPNTVAHCEYFANAARDKANASRELAASHEQMAKDAAVAPK